jgi:hypothetical protein
MGSALLMCAMVACATGFVGCGSGGDDVVYLHVLHAYPGAASMSLYGPEGAIVSGLSFGQTTEAPVAFNRENFDGTLTLVMDGLPGSVPINTTLFELYPQETATLVIGRRVDQADVQVSTIRHTIFSPVDSAVECILSPVNMISTTNNGATRNAYSFMSELFADADTIRRSYNTSLETQIDTECGPINLNQLGPEGARILAERIKAIQRVQQRGLLLPVLDPQDANRLLYVSGFWVGDTLVKGVPTSLDFRKCISSAIQLQQPEAEMMDPNAPAQGETTCKYDLQGRPIVPFNDANMNGVLDPNEQILIEVNAEAVAACLGNEENGYATTDYQGIVYEPGVITDAQVLLTYRSNGTNCSSRWRIITPVITTIYDQGEVRGSGLRAEDQIPTFQTNHPRFTTQGVIVYGRPLDPLIYQFVHADRSELTGEYPGGKDFDPLPPQDRTEQAPGRGVQ